MRKRNYTGIVPVPGRRPGKIPKTKTELPDQAEENMKPDYVKKYYKPEKPVRSFIQLKLWGNPFDDLNH